MTIRSKPLHYIIGFVKYFILGSSEQLVVTSVKHEDGSPPTNIIKKEPASSSSAGASGSGNNVNSNDSNNNNDTNDNKNSNSSGNSLQDDKDPSNSITDECKLKTMEITTTECD